MADFSNCSAASLAGIAGYVRQGGRLYDELLIETLRMIDPPLLSPAGMCALRREIDPTRSRGKGRPRKEELDRQELVALVETKHRPDVSREIKSSIIKRLQSGKRYTENDWAKPQVRERRLEDRNFLLWVMYRPIYLMLGAAPPYKHEVIGEVDLGDIDPSLSRHEQALRSLKKVVRRRFGLKTPSERTIDNCISIRKNNQKMRVSDAASG